MDVCEVNKEDDLVVTHRIAGRISAVLRIYGRARERASLCLLRVFDARARAGSMTEIDMDDWTRFADYRGYG